MWSVVLHPSSRSNMTIFSIKDLENLTGVKAHTIRIWEQRYSFLKPGRTTTNIRFYNSEELKSILNISLLNNHGYKISEIAGMDQADIRDRLLSLDSSEALREKILNQLVMLMIDMDMNAFESLLDKHVEEKGIGNTIADLIPSFIERIGVFWVNGHANEVQQRLVSNILRQKLLFAINSLEVHDKKNKSILFFLPGGEQQELALLYMAYLVKRIGLNAIYLGANLPLSDLLSVAKFKKPDYIITHLSWRIPAFEKFLSKYQQQLPQIPLIITSHSSQSIFKKPLPEVIIKKNLQEIPSFFESI
jgi:DNA-binding transcriptional MerR regulator